MFSLLFTGLIVSKNTHTVLEAFIQVYYVLPTMVINYLFPVLFPAAIIYGASFGLRKLVRVGYTISDRLKKVEDKA